MRKYRGRAERACQWIERRLYENGSLGPEVNDLACYYKVPYLFSLLGRVERAHRMLNYVEQNLLQEDGDFLSEPGLKSMNPTFTEFWAYPNAWLVMASQRMARFDISHRAYQYLTQYFHSPTGGFLAHQPHLSTVPIVDAITTAHLGFTALYLGDREKAVRAGNFLMQLAEKQQDVDSFYLRADSVGELITDPIPEQKGLYCVSRAESDQLYFAIGYPMGFLVRLFRATQEPHYLDAAKRYADFALSCEGTMRSSIWSHKVMWGTALLARISGENKYAEFSRQLAEYLIDTQDDDGCWVPEEPFYVTVDQTAEVAIWLTETEACLAHMEPIKTVYQT